MLFKFPEPPLMDAINHMSVTRAQLAEYVEDKGIQDKVLIPIDGETLSF